MRSWLHKKACCYWSKSQTNLAWPVSSIRAHSIFMGEISLTFDKKPPRLTALSLTISAIILAFPLWQHFPLRRDLGCVFRFLLPPTINYQCSVAYDKMQRYFPRAFRISLCTRIIPPLREWSLAYFCSSRANNFQACSSVPWRLQRVVFMIFIFPTIMNRDLYLLCD